MTESQQAEPEYIGPAQTSPEHTGPAQTGPAQTGPQRRRMRNVAIIAAAVGVVLTVGVGTASASDRGSWGRKHRSGHASPTASASPRPTTSRSVTPSATKSGTASSGAATPTKSASGSASSSGSKGLTLPPANTGLDYQIGSPYTVPAGVGVISRDHGVSPAAGVYNICYVNGFQAQPEELSTWKRDHDDLLLKQGSSYVVDGDWNEVLFDTSTSAKRDALAKIVGGWMDECAAKGFLGVEVDNLDSWTRSKSLLTQAHAVAYAKLLTAYAHGKGLAIGQKNTVELASIGKSQLGFDFAVAESCVDYEITSGTPECQGFVDTYGAQVYVIEYDNSHFQQACTRYGGTLSIVQRDQNVTAPGSSSYVFKSC